MTIEHSDCIFPNSKQTGYVKVQVAVVDGRSVLDGAHRVAWASVHGPVPEGHEVHHRCRNPRCINIDHLELMTRGDHARLHAAEVTHCPQGHEYTPENTVIQVVRGYECRKCRECKREVRRRWWREVGKARRQESRVS